MFIAIIFLGKGKQQGYLHIVLFAKLGSMKGSV